MPDTQILTFASRLHDRDPPQRYVDRKAYESYLANHPHNEFRTVFPVREGQWQDAEDLEYVAQEAKSVIVRHETIALPSANEYERCGIELEQAPRVQVFELCRYLADRMRELVLATPEERRISVLPEMSQILQLEEWNHPNLLLGERPSSSETFQQITRVLSTGDVGLYQPKQPSNTHWRHWPEGGRR